MAKNATWLKRRAAILERDENRCQTCGALGLRLHVHHRYYQEGKKIWDYEDDSLISLCSRCHGKADEMRRRLSRAIGLLPFGEEDMVLAFIETRGAAIGDRLLADSVARTFGVSMASGVDPERIKSISDEAGFVTLEDLKKAELEQYRSQLAVEAESPKRRAGISEVDA